jgi:hypothetical protein
MFKQAGRLMTKAATKRRVPFRFESPDMREGCFLEKGKRDH